MVEERNDCVPFPSWASIGGMGKGIELRPSSKDP